MRPLSESTSRIAGKNFSRKYIAIGRIVKNWDEIVGANLADKAQPIKIQYRKARKKGQKLTATLEIAASSADATLLHYQKDLILERINQIFGDKWITAIRFVNVSVNTAPLSRHKRKKSHPPLTINEKKTLSTMTDIVADAEIRQKLEHLGLAILTGNK